MDWKQALLGKEALYWKGRYNHAVKLCKAIYEHRDYISQIKIYLAYDYPIGAAELWNELDYPVQKLLITAPRFGGPFTTEERAKIKELWEISADDLEASK